MSRTPSSCSTTRASGTSTARSTSSTTSRAPAISLLCRRRRPRLTHLIVGAGTLDHPVHNLSFVGLTFADSSWLGVEQSGGWAAIQAEFAAPKLSGDPKITDTTWRKMAAAVSFTGRPGHAFRGRHLHATRRRGPCARRREAATTSSRARRSRASHGNGIELGDVFDSHPHDPREVVSGNQIVANTISDVGAEYAGSVAIWAGYVRGTTIGWNRISDVPYSAISVGWGWGRRDQPGNPAGHNLIVDNRIDDYLLRLPDGGGVYLLGKQPGTIVEGNVISKQHHPGAGLYLDDGSHGETVRGNAVWDTGGAPFTFKGTGLTIVGNYWEQPDGGYGLSFLGSGVVKDNTVIAGPRDVPPALLAGAGPKGYHPVHGGACAQPKC